MRYLLDTHTAIWALENKNKLPETVKEIIDDTSLPLYVSVLSVWEIAIKISIGKLKFSGGSQMFIEKMRHNGVELLEIKSLHVSCVETLPFLHRDPFDRLLVATAKTEGMTILTADENIQKYDISWIW